MLTAHAASQSAIGAVLGKDAVLRPFVSLPLTLLLLQEKRLGAKSFWAPYLALLPTGSHTAAEWQWDEFQELEGTAALTPAIRLLKSVVMQYTYLVTRLLPVGFDLLLPCLLLTAATAHVHALHADLG